MVVRMNGQVINIGQVPGQVIHLNPMNPMQGQQFIFNQPQPQQRIYIVLIFSGFYWLRSKYCELITND